MISISTTLLKNYKIIIMKTIKLSTTILLLLLSNIVFSQNRKAHKEKIKAMKVGFITSKLDLTPKEAQIFWPVFNEFNTKMDAIHSEKRKLKRKERENENLNNEELEKIVDNHIVLEQKELDIKKEYHIQFKRILPINKVAKLYRANHDFKKELLRKLRVKKGGPNELNIPPPPKKH